jgi:nucleoid DNA-binding protein
MTKGDLVAKVAEEMTESKAKTVRFLDAFLSSVQGALSDGRDVTLYGFGKFHVATQKARVGVNPQTGKPIDILAKKKVKFAPQKALREAVA